VLSKRIHPDGGSCNGQNVPGRRKKRFSGSYAEIDPIAAPCNTISFLLKREWRYSCNAEMFGTRYTPCTQTRTEIDWHTRIHLRIKIRQGIAGTSSCARIDVNH